MNAARYQPIRFSSKPLLSCRVLECVREVEKTGVAECTEMKSESGTESLTYDVPLYTSRLYTVYSVSSTHLILHA